MPYPEPLPLWQSTADLYLHRRHSNTVLPQSLRGTWVLVHTKFIWALWASLVGMGFDSKCELAPPTILLGLLLCPWMWGISSQLVHYVRKKVCFVFFCLFVCFVFCFLFLFFCKMFESKTTSSFSEDPQFWSSLLQFHWSKKKKKKR